MRHLGEEWDFSHSSFNIWRSNMLFVFGLFVITVSVAAVHVMEANNQRHYALEEVEEANGGQS
jgi:hypothetical protein